MSGEFERILHGGKVLKDTTAMTAEREALRMGVEHLMTLFPAEAKHFQFVVENECRETKYKVDSQSMRLFGLRNDHAEDVHRADANRLENMKDEFEGRWRMEEEEMSRLSRSLSSSVHVDISDSGSFEEMSQKHYKLGAKPKWSAHADWPNLSEDTYSTVEGQITVANHYDKDCGRTDVWATKSRSQKK